MSRVLVLGTGSIGRLVVARLLELDDQPCVLTRDPDRARRVLPDTAEVVAGDLNDTAGVDAVVMTHGALYRSGDYEAVVSQQ